MVDGRFRSELPAILDLYGFGIVETETKPPKKHPGIAESLQGGLF